MGWRRGELNLGQLVRQAYGKAALLVGFTTHHGTVTAASDWGQPAQRKKVSAALEGSYETLFHDTKIKGFLLDLRTGNEATRGLRESRLERSSGSSARRSGKKATCRRPIPSAYKNRGQSPISHRVA